MNILQLDLKMTYEKRQFLFDNMKVLLMCLVVFGHFLEKISIEGGYGIIRAWIYSFHMPAFVFISGYFSKHTSEDEIKTITYCLILILYLIQRIVYIFIKR